jgi:hypothetical protein
MNAVPPLAPQKHKKSGLHSATLISLIAYSFCIGYSGPLTADPFPK